MKILLLGEFSGFYSNLKKGFIQLGHEAHLYASRDSFKEIDGIDSLIESTYKNKTIRKIDLAFKFILCFLKARNYDAVFLINPAFLEPRILSSLILWYLKRFNRFLFLSACGEDVPYIRFGKEGGYKWWIYEEQPNCEGVSSARYQNRLDFFVHNQIIKYVDGVIPTSYGYRLSWLRYHENLVCKSIPPAIDSSSIPFISQDKSYKDQKVVFFHGINRPCHKGTYFIISALEKLRDARPNEVEIIIDGNLPLKEYLSLLEKVDVVVDQCLGYDYMSMNAMYSLALGKIVCVSAVDESFNYFGISEHPIVQIEPNIDQIFKKLLKVVDQKTDIPRMQKESRSFVERENNSKSVARLYCDLILEKSND